MTVWAIVVAAGSGARFGGRKQFEELKGRRVVDWAVAGCRSVADSVVVVVPPDRLDDETLGDVLVAGGATRSASVRCGLEVVDADAEVIVVHDGARPFASPSLFVAVVAAVGGGADAAVPGVPVGDTIKQVREGRVIATLDRTELFAVQTPQAFLGPVLRRAHATCGEATDDAALVEEAGGRVVVVPGDPANTKITVRSDLG